MVTACPPGHGDIRSRRAGAARPLEVIVVLIAAVVSAALLGYLAGLLSFKVKDRWCPRCGSTTAELARGSVGHEP
jgi:hypothetical protein